MELRKQSFIRGTFILTAAAFFTRALGFVNGIILARFLGKEGMGLLMIAHPLLPLFITLTELGLPAAISKLVSEAEAKGDTPRVKRILVVSLTITGTLSITLTTLALIGSKWIASIFLPDPRAYLAMVALTPIIPIVAMTAVLRGYFRGKQNMTPLALSDVLENLMQIGVVIGVIHWLLPYGVEYAAAGAMVSAVVGEAVGLLYLFAIYRLSRNPAEDAGTSHPSAALQDGRTLRDLLRLGIPLTGSGLIHSVFHAFLPMLVIHSLLLSGVGAAAAATGQFGLLTGFVFPLLFLPGFFTQSLSNALIPAISEATVDHNDRLIHYRMDVAMRIALYVGAPCTILLFLWAEPLMTVIYRAPEAGPLLQLLVPFFFFYYFQAPLQAILLGLGKSSTVMWNLIISNLFEVIAIFVLGVQFGIRGVALAIGIGVCLLTFLHFWSISNSIGFYTDFRTVLKAISGTSAMTLCGLAAYSFLEHAGASLFVTVFGAVFVSLLIYVSFLRAFRPFQPEPATPLLK